jgi:hypothetical protein
MFDWRAYLLEGINEADRRRERKRLEDKQRIEETVARSAQPKRYVNVVAYNYQARFDTRAEAEAAARRLVNEKVHCDVWTCEIQSTSSAAAQTRGGIK